MTSAASRQKCGFALPPSLEWCGVFGIADLRTAKLNALEQVSAVHVPVAERRQYRLGVKYRKTLVNRINRIQNHIRALFDHQGISIPGGHRAWTSVGIKTLGQHHEPLAECQLDEFWRGELDLELQSLDALWQQLQQVDDQLERVAEQDDQVQLLQTIPGVGRRTAEIIVAALDNPHRFQNARQVSAYAGLVPDQRHNFYGDATRTGQTNRLGRVTCRGSRILCSALAG